MRPSTIWYTLKQGIKNIKRNWMFSLASIITMAACIFLFGIFFSIVNNVNNVAHKVEQEVPITVFFDKGTTNKQIKAIGKKIKERPEVEKIEFTSADEAWEEFKETYFQGSEAADGFKDDNPLANQANYSVYMNDITKQSELVSYIEGLKHVRLVNLPYRDKINHTGQHIKFVQNIGYRCIIAEIKSDQRYSSTDNSQHNAFQKEWSSYKCIGRSYVLHDSDFFLTNCNTDRYCIADQENRNDK